MAIKTQSVRGYWASTRRRSISIIVLVELLIVIVVFSVAVMMRPELVDNVYFWTFAVLVAVCNAIAHVIILLALLSPLRLLSAAVVRVSGEPSSVPAPNPNTPRIERSGLKPLLDIIYSEGVDSAQAPAEVAPVSDQSTLVAGLAYTNVGLVVIDEHHNIVYANQAAPVHEDAAGKKELEVLFDGSPTFSEWLAECEADAIHAEHTWERVPSRPMGEQGRKLYDMTASYQKGNAALAIITFFEKTTEYEPDDDDLNFVAFAAHELRGPITVIRGYLDTLEYELDTVLTADQKELFGRLTVSANRLTSYVNNILNTARYDRRHLNIHLQEARLSDVYATVADDMELRASSQGRLLSVTIPTDLPTIAADPASLGEVLSNLVDNAIKYSPEGGSVEVSARGDGENVEVSVTDHGIGMPANVVSNLFHKFYRSHRSRETVPGTGIGLYISKAIVESHGGTMGARSVEGEGSTFTFTVSTYAAVADKLQKTGGANTGIIKHGTKGWIKNHGAIRG